MRQETLRPTLLSMTAAVFLLVSVPGAHALTKAELAILIELESCSNDCTLQLRTCTKGCCGLIFCRNSCIGTCDTNYNTCLGGCALTCSTCDPDGAFFDTATLAPNGRTINVGGPLVCPAGATADLDVTLTQSGTGAVATGHTQVRCADSETSFTLDAHTIGSATFLSESAAQACGTARIHAVNLSIDSFQWCRDITILTEGIQLGE